MPCARDSEQGLNPFSHAGSRRRTGLTHKLPDLGTAEHLTVVLGFAQPPLLRSMRFLRSVIKVS